MKPSFVVIPERRCRERFVLADISDRKAPTTTTTTTTTLTRAIRSR